MSLLTAGLHFNHAGAPCSISAPPGPGVLNVTSLQGWGRNGTSEQLFSGRAERTKAPRQPSPTLRPQTNGQGSCRADPHTAPLTGPRGWGLQALDLLSLSGCSRQQSGGGQAHRHPQNGLHSPAAHTWGFPLFYSPHKERGPVICSSLGHRVEFAG